MDKYLVEDYLPKAHEIVEKVLVNKVNNIDEYRNKMSSFATTVTMNGLLPAFAYYYKNDENVVKLFAEREGKTSNDYFNDLINKKKANKEDELEEIKNDVLTFATSLKLVLNLYKGKK